MSAGRTGEPPDEPAGDARPCPEPPSPPEAGALILCSVASTAAALIAYEVVLMRRLLLEHWHHFGFLVISLALLGFGASGTLLALAERSVRQRPATWLHRLALALVVSLLALPRAAAALPVTVRFIPQDLGAQAGWWSLYALCALLPFLLGAAFLGVSLMTAGRHVGRVYAANLMGSAAGALGGVLVLSRFPIETGLWPSLGLAVMAAACLGRSGSIRVPWTRRSPPRVFRTTGPLLLAAICMAVEWAWPLRIAYDEHKYGALLARLEAQGSSRRLAAASDPHGHVELHESPLFHDLPFVAPGLSPPPMMSVAINGDAAGSVLRIDGAAEVSVMDRTLMALPYRWAPPRPRVLLLGEVGGAHVWLARRRGAESITVVQPNRALLGLLRRYAPALLAGADVEVAAVEPRRFLESADARCQYDVIQIAALEGLGAGGAGVRGLSEEPLATVEGFAACLRRLRPGGVLAVCRGVQFPERENIRLLATLAEALESTGAQPPPQMIQVRDYLGVCTMALSTPMDDERRDMVRQVLHAEGLTPVWFDGIRPDEVNQPDALPGPPGEPVDWLHFAARQIVADPDAHRRRARREAFYAAWMFNVRPARDDRPFFWDFYKPKAVGELRRVYGELWLTRADLGRLFLYASLALVGAAAVLLIVVPLGIQRIILGKRRRDGPGPGAAAPAGGPGRLAALTYFAAIGVGFMGIEMALISRATAVLGDPVLASAAVIAGVLLLSGLGSLTLGGGSARWAWLGPLVVAALAVAASTVLYAPGAARSLAAAVAVGLPLAWIMGVAMPAGLNRLEAVAGWLTPWAWGVNGISSVMATSAAIASAMDFGYRVVLLGAAACYLAAAAAAHLFMREARTV